MEKKINIVQKGLNWKVKTHVEINIKEVAHPVDKVLEKSVRNLRAAA